MRNKNLIIYSGIAILIVGLLVGNYFMFFYSPWKFTEDRPIKIFILNSFHPEFPPGIINEYIQGFEYSLERNGLTYYELKQYDMDVLRNDKNMTEIALYGKKLIDAWNPDLILATDEEAQKYLIQPYYLGTNTPVVFAGLIGEPSDYGYVGSKNIAGVLEREHLVDAINYLQEIFPNVKKIAVIAEEHPRWIDVFKRLKEDKRNISDVEFIGWHTISEFEEFKKIVLDYQESVDAFLFTPFDYLTDKEGRVGTTADVAKWISENSNLPEISLWVTPRVGMLAAISYSPYEQGKAAGELAYLILIEGEKPSSFEFKPTKKGDKYINLARAKTLGLDRDEISSTVLINSRVYETFPWEAEK